MGMPDFAKGMRVPVDRCGLVNSGSIAWVFYESRRQREKMNEPVVTIARRKESRRKPVSAVYLAPDPSPDRSIETLVTRAVGSLGPLLTRHFMPLFAGLGRRMHIL